MPYKLILENRAGNDLETQIAVNFAFLCVYSYRCLLPLDF